MYLPAHFEEANQEALHAFIRGHPLATLVLDTGDGLSADHVPLMLESPAAAGGKLLGHVARANPLWRRAAAGVPCLAIFNGTQGYISPNWYATKAQTAKVVPTWNYEVVHVNGRIRPVDDRVWLRAFLERLTREHEARQATPWQLGDAPTDYIERLLGAIIGIEVDIERIVGKAKLSQNQPQANQQSVIAALRAAGDAASADMAHAVERRTQPTINLDPT